MHKDHKVVLSLSKDKKENEVHDTPPETRPLHRYQRRKEALHCVALHCALNHRRYPASVLSAFQSIFFDQGAGKALHFLSIPLAYHFSDAEHYHETTTTTTDDLPTHTYYTRAPTTSSEDAM